MEPESELMLSPLPENQALRFQNLEYSTITQEDPANYSPKQFTSKIRALGTSAPCQVLICVTLYNESSYELQSTMSGILKNVENMLQNNLCDGPVSVVIIQDGLEKLHPSMKQFGKSMSIFELDQIQDSPSATLHTFFTEFVFAKNEKDTYPTINLITGIKHSNKGKINSHRWFFKCFATHISPKYCILLDCGTIPSDFAIYKIVEAMENNQQLGGACGNIVPEDPKICHPIEISQDIEYRVSHFMDKCLEGILGFVNVLPGAFCGYRWEAIKGDPLDKHYFYAFREDSEINCWKANMLLAEDQLLSVSTVLNKDSKYTLSYIEDAKVTTDIPDTYPSIMQQRRRWINGSRFAFLRTLLLFGNLPKTKHSLCRKFLFVLYIFYQSLNVVVGALAPAIYFLYIFYIFLLVFGTEDYYGLVTWSAGGLYGCCMVSLVVVSLVPKSVHRFKGTYMTCAGLLGFLTVSSFCAVSYEILRSEITLVVGFYIGVLFFGIFVCAAVHGQLKEYSRGMFQYLYMLPSFLSIYLIYAFCNLHDVTWGIRNDQNGKCYAAQNVKGFQEKEKSFKTFRLFWLVGWIALSLAFVALMLV